MLLIFGQLHIAHLHSDCQIFNKSSLPYLHILKPSVYSICISHTPLIMKAITNDYLVLLVIDLLYCFLIADIFLILQVHFEADQYENKRQDGLRRLKPNAVPTLFPKSFNKTSHYKWKPSKFDIFPTNSQSNSGNCQENTPDSTLKETSSNGLLTLIFFIEFLILIYGCFEYLIAMQYRAYLGAIYCCARFTGHQFLFSITL